MNRENMLKVADSIEKETNGYGFDIVQWTDKNKCGTTACVAGHAMVVMDREDVLSTYRDLLQSIRDGDGSPIFRRYTVGRNIKDSAASFLGIDANEAERLFVPLGHMELINKNAHLVPDAIRWMALTGRIDWRDALNAARCVKEMVK